MNLRIVETKDGLHSLYVPELDEHYHSTHGALQEAEHVFINAGLQFTAETRREIAILEIGFGTGLNAFLSLLHAEKAQLKIDYVGLELYPVPVDVAKQLNYAKVIGVQEPGSYYLLHETDWGTSCPISPFFSLTKRQLSVFEFEGVNQFDLIYFDAFGFRAQEEMWSQQVFDTMFACLKSGGVLVTYSSKGEVRRRMQNSGFRVEKLAGPAGKREMVRAYKEGR